MELRLNEAPAVDAALIERLQRVSFPTLGHYLEEGFADPLLQRQVGTTRIVGRAITVRTTAADSTMLHHAAGVVEPGDVLVVDTGGDRRHASTGLVVASAAKARGAVGIVVDGVVTDVDEIAELGLPVYGYGRSILTTKLQSLAHGALNEPIVVGGVAVRAGDIVLADANGVYFGAPTVLADIIETALADDAGEPRFIERVTQAGERLGDHSGATATLGRLMAAAEARSEP